ncbi:hypothetical protein AM1BK_06810 [Neobacillus kokaensis]|uniref:Uncharacterized protein n=1 Tax=Neobacillus kokaensis TaxID=2759023 RepID=A0ABQ3MZH3_9BACI|nr:hypothetical protein AM1BK_06810 [Neobacillus kokaensis]
MKKVKANRFHCPKKRKLFKKGNARYIQCPKKERSSKKVNGSGTIDLERGIEYSKILDIVS